MRSPTAVLLWLGLSACDGDDATSDGPAAQPEVCDGAPVVTWDNFGAGFVIEACQSCHASTTPERHDAPPNVVFDAEEDVWAWAPQVLDLATGDTPSMPPQGGVADDDRYLLEVWLTCANDPS